ncbi:MAG: GNAT family N-acetyltransferase [Deltaproteobacteria bacterium]|nr:GNAT family N-acetyltransferase [Deltaproteobacteria bacterium]
MNSHYLEEIILVRPAFDDWAALAECPERGCEGLGAMCGECGDAVRQCAAEVLQSVKTGKVLDGTWSRYLALDKASSQVVGFCRFAGLPDESGAVEIMCTTFPRFEGLGCGTLMAKELIAFATSFRRIKKVVAHTDENNEAACQVLRRLGFENCGLQSDEEATARLRWEFYCNGRELISPET